MVTASIPSLHALLLCCHHYPSSTPPRALHFVLAGNNLKVACPAGYYGSSVGSTSPTCDGQCSAGYFCPAGSSSPTETDCAGLPYYCPPGTSTRLACSSNQYTGPLLQPVNLRYTCNPCIANRQCTNGVIVPGVDFSSSCPGGSSSFSVTSGTGPMDVGPALVPAVPGWPSPTLTYNLSGFLTNDEACAPPVIDGIVSFKPSTGRFAVGPGGIPFLTCLNGFQVTLTATRAGDPYDSATSPQAASCTLTVSLVEGPVPANLTCASTVFIDEFSPIGTSLPADAVVAVNSNLQSNLEFSIVTVQGNLPGGVVAAPSPLLISLCTGALTVTGPLRTWIATYYNVSIRVDNVGPWVGTYPAMCNMTVVVQHVNEAPVLGITSFYVSDFSTVAVGNSMMGKPIGSSSNVMATDANLGDVVTGFSFVNASYMPFAIDASGNITYARNDLNGLVTSTLILAVNFTDGSLWVTQPVTFFIVVSPRPPTCFAQYLNISEAATPGTALGQPLLGSHPTGEKFFFSLVDPTGTFVVNNITGVVSVSSTSGPLSFGSRSMYNCQLSLTTASGVTNYPSCPVTITLLQIPRPPAFLQGTFALSVPEGALPGAVVGTPLAATSPNAGKPIVFGVVSCTPLVAGRCLFAVDGLSGQVSYAGSVPLAWDSTLVYAGAQSFNLNVSVTINEYQMSGTATVNVQIINIAPRLNLPAFLSLPSLLVGSQLVLAVSNYTILPAGYSFSAVTFDGTALTRYPATTAEGGQLFTMDPTGQLTLVPVLPAVNYNTRSTFILQLAVRYLTSATTKQNITVYLAHINRPPSWPATTYIASVYAAEVSPYASPIGSPLSTLVSDPDLSLPMVNERLTYSIVGGNTDSTFGLLASSGACLAEGAVSGVGVNGQLCVNSSTSKSFMYFAPPSINSFFLNVSVTDAGVDGPAYTAYGIVNVTVSPSTAPSTMPFFNLTVVEHSAVGTTVGFVVGQSPVCLSPSQCDSVFSYSIAPLTAGPPFPFAITTVPASPLAHGQVTIIGGQGPINYSPYAGQGNFRTYMAVVTLTETRVGIPYQLTYTGSLQINVLYRAENPFFNPAVVPPAAPGQLNSYAFTVYVGEHASAGVNATFVLASNPTPDQVYSGTPAQITALSKDPWQLLSYRLSTASTVFGITSTTGQLSVIDGSSLDYNTRTSYVLNVIATDANALTDSATVTVKIVDENDRAVFIGLYDAVNATMLAGNNTSVNETAAVGTIIGFVRFSDRDRSNPFWASKTYALQGATPFAVHPLTGAVSVSGPLQYYDTSTYTVTVTCTDADLITPLTAVGSFTVNINQANVLTIANLSAPFANFAAGDAVSASSAPYAAAFAGTNDMMFATTGSSVIILGSGFGYTASRLAAQPSLVQPAVSVTFGPAGDEYQLSASACVISSPNTAITCAVPAGVGRDLRWRVSVGPFKSLPSARCTSYFPPVIASVAKNGDASGLLDTDPARFNDQLVVTGAYFGPSLVLGLYSPVFRLSFGPPGAENTYVTGPCVMQTQQTTLLCPSVPGVGAGLSMKLYAGFELSPQVWRSDVVSSAPFLSSISFKLPVLVAVTSVLSPTRGGTRFNLTGSQFGPVGNTNLVVSYGRDLSGAGTSPIFAAAQCVVPPGGGHTVISCVTVPGVGSSFTVRVAVAGQVSPVVPAGLGYAAPTIIYDPTKGRPGLSGAVLDVMSTRGGATVSISGDNFGPANVLLPDGISAVLPSASYGTGIAGYPTIIARSCQVSVPHTEIVCMSNEGVGAHLKWSVAVDGQASAPLLNVTTSYAPPIVTSYSGAGVTADTVGGEGVNITGDNFGPAGTPVGNVTYGPTGVEFTGRNCVLALPHTGITCATAPGAGRNLQWRVIVGNQVSTFPSTAYLPPVVLSFAGPGAVNASTDGGDVVVVTGLHFSTQAFLQGVTYGASGNEYAPNCSISVPHTQITCITVPGTGRALQWIVRVGGQTSEASSMLTSYAIPAISSITPGHASTAGGQRVTLTGSSFGLLASRASVAVYMNSVGLPEPGDIADHFNRIYSGNSDAGSPTVAWMSQLATPSTLNPQAIAHGTNSIDFVTPEGFGAGRAVFLVVNGVPSNAVRFDYDPPVITNVAPDRINVTAGYLRLTIEGNNFCSGLNGCGTLLIDGAATSPLSWSHTRVVSIVRDPNGLYAGASSNVAVSVGGTTSNTVAFSSPVPSVTSLVGQGSWGGTATEQVTKASVSFAVSVVSSSLDAASAMATAAGAAMRGVVASSVAVRGANVDISSITDAVSGLVTSVAPTDAANTALVGRRLASIQGGFNISFAIDVAANALATASSLTPATINTVIANISSSLAAPSFVAAFVTALSAATGVPAVSISASFIIASLSVSVTSNPVPSGRRMSTLGGEPFFIAGVAGLATVDEASIAIYFGPYVCFNVTKTRDGDLGPANGVSPSSPLASEYYTFNIACSTPPGIGANLPIRVSVPGGTSAAVPDFVFTYAAPKVTGVVDTPSFGSLSYAYTAQSRSLSGFPTVGTAAGAITIRGSGFGSTPLVTALCGTTPCPSLSAVPPTLFRVMVTDSNSGAVVDLTSTAIIVDDGAISVTIPAGVGSDLQLSVIVGGQLDASLDALGQRNVTLVRYAAPAVQAAYNPATGLQRDGTMGGTLLTILGSNFGGLPGTATPAMGLPVVTVGGRPMALCTAALCPLLGAYTPRPDHSRIDGILPEGWGMDLPIVVTVSGQSSVAASSGPSTYTYAQPMLSGISPAAGPTSGRSLGGVPLNVTLTGTNLGRGNSSVVLSPISASATQIVVPESAFLVHNHTTIVFAMPEGSGNGFYVSVDIGGQSSTTPGSITFAYDPPSVSAVGSVEPQFASCAPLPHVVRASGSGVGNGTLSSSALITKFTYPGCFPTDADPPKTLRIAGASFGPSSQVVDVSIGRRACPVVSHDHNTIYCTLPAGLGDSNAVVVTVAGSSNSQTAASQFGYDAPVVVSTLANPPDALNGHLITLQGFNFGPYATAATVLIGGLRCGGAVWQ